MNGELTRGQPFAHLARRLRSVPMPVALGYGGGLSAYLLLMALTTGLRSDEVLLCSLALALAFWSDRTREILSGLLPFLLWGIAYDLMHFTQPLVRYLHVHVSEPYAFDKAYFGIRTATGVLTPNEYFGLHNWPVVDLVTGTAYLIFLYWSLGFAAWLALFRPDAAGRQLLVRFGWTFLAMNLVGFATYYIYPAAPPWYAADHGLGPADMAARASAAGAARWDTLTGIPYFANFYGRAADVFGAIPSLHVAYPLLTFLYGLELRKRWFDVATFTLFAVVCFAAIYLNHHYVLDVLVGVTYALVCWALERVLRRVRSGRGAEPSPS